MYDKSSVDREACENFRSKRDLKGKVLKDYTLFTPLIFIYLILFLLFNL